MKVCKHKDIKIIDSPFRTSIKAIEFKLNKKRIFYHFSNLEQATFALNKITSLEYCCSNDIHEILSNLCGSDFFKT